MLKMISQLAITPNATRQPKVMEIITIILLVQLVAIRLEVISCYRFHKLMLWLLRLEGQLLPVSTPWIINMLLTILGPMLMPWISSSNNTLLLFKCFTPPLLSVTTTLLRSHTLPKYPFLLAVLQFRLCSCWTFLGSTMKMMLALRLYTLLMAEHSTQVAVIRKLLAIQTGMRLQQ